MELCVDNICMYVTKLCWGYVDVGWVELLFCPSYIKWSWILCQTDLDAFMCRKWFDMKWLILNLFSNITFEVKKVHTIETYPEKWINCVGKKLQMVICRHQVHPTVGVKQSACWYQRTGEKFLDVLNVETSDIIRHHCIRGIGSQGDEMKTRHAEWDSSNCLNHTNAYFLRGF